MDKQTPMKQLFEMLAFEANRSLSIAFVSVLYAIMGMILSTVVSKTIDAMPLPRGDRTSLTMHVLFHVCLITMTASVMRRVITTIPYPLDGWGGWDHANLLEINGGIIISFIMFTFQEDLTTHLGQLRAAWLSPESDNM